MCFLVSNSLLAGEERTSNGNSEEMNPGCVYLTATYDLVSSPLKRGVSGDLRGITQTLNS